MASSILGSAMQKNWTPAAQLAMEGVGQAGKLAASMDKEQTVTTTRNGGGNSGIGGLLGTGLGFVASMIPGMQPFGLALMAGGGALGGAADAAINGGDVLGGAVGGGITGAMAGWGGAELMGFKDAGAMAQAAGTKMGIDYGAAAAAGGVAAAGGAAEVAAGKALLDSYGLGELAGVGTGINALGSPLAGAPGFSEAMSAWASPGLGVAQNLVGQADSAYLNPNVTDPKIKPFIQQAGKNSRYGV